MNVVLSIKNFQLREVLEILAQTGKITDIVINIEEEKTKQTLSGFTMDRGKQQEEETKEKEY